MPTESWFPTLIFHEDLEVPEDARARALECISRVVDERTLARYGRYTAAHGPNALHLEPQMRPLLDVLAPSVRGFLFDDLRLDRGRARLYMGRCWPVVETGAGAAELHTHGGAVVSGVFYLETPEGAGGLAFHRPFAYAYSGLARTAQTPLTFERVEYQAVRDRLVLFASNVPHTALPSAPGMAQPRIAVAFDLYATSDIANPVGGMPDLEYLVGL